MNSEKKDYGFISANDVMKESGKYGFVHQYPNSSKIEETPAWMSSLKEYGKTALKGTVEGVSKLGRMMGPLETGKSSQEIQENQTNVLNELLPTEDTFGERGLRRGLNMAPTMMGFPGGAIQSGIRSGIAGFVGETAKELGAGEGLQTAAELTAFIGPDLAKKLLESGKNGKLIQFAKKMGMTDAQIAPLLQSEFKQKWLSKLTPKRGSTQTALAETKKGLDETYGILQKSEAAGKEISEKDNGTLINELMEMLNDMPEAVRGKIEKDLGNLLNNKITGNRLIDFWKDINHYLSDNAKQLSRLKQPIKKALSSISPELAKDFEMVNELYTKYHTIAARLKPNLYSDIVSAGQSLGIAGSGVGIMFGVYPPLIAIAGTAAAKKLAQQLLINPRLQNLSKKMVNALNSNKFGIAKKLAESFGNQIEKYSPKAAKALQNVSEEDLKEMFNQKEKARLQS